MSEAPSGSPAAWRPATPADLPAMLAIQDTVHAMLPEREAVFADKLRLFPEGCRVLVRDGATVGYGLAHPWRLDAIPPLDTEMGALPDKADCLFVHDVALLPAARGRGAARAFIRHAWGVAGRHGWPALALVSVYGTVPLWAACGFAPRPLEGLAGKLAAYGETACYMTALSPPGAA